ncbi:hypothetical protein XBFFL1_2380022 [Xenorhabdus bovienii str. feltiae Florida]|uniref:Uncharacterized protein n=2 Tax=Xenorhabdus bovienii TaxID=40576 RepID=A0A0B6X9A5_XENBV|nr:hypothetical protein XBFFR1_310114 [Xenorhabdus bovienii str. feltiae France]CDG92969.1 hypothetical protein XBFFL1_2380022 [Xenorhabdus bovienii str. feltiae Florida]CDH03353.1 hypothetical protein XBFM1_750024 [Xenorhabdus bovienii str. feltiae Moldova]CDM88869.1 protein of unknown function [Xenorhabdus bovienii]
MEAFINQLDQYKLVTRSQKCEDNKQKSPLLSGMRFAQKQ